MPGVSELWKLISFVCCFEDLQDDPYDPNEADPVRCRALESSLWELKVSLTNIGQVILIFGNSSPF